MVFQIGFICRFSPVRFRLPHPKKGQSMGDTWYDFACAGCGDFFEGMTCNTEEEEKAYFEKHGKEVHYCPNCKTFTELESGKKVKVVFPSYGTAKGWTDFFNGLDEYIREFNLKRNW